MAWQGNRAGRVAAAMASAAVIAAAAGQLALAPVAPASARAAPVPPGPAATGLRAIRREATAGPPDPGARDPEPPEREPPGPGARAAGRATAGPATAGPVTPERSAVPGPGPGAHEPEREPAAAHARLRAPAGNVRPGRAMVRAMPCGGAGRVRPAGPGLVQLVTMPGRGSPVPGLLVMLPGLASTGAGRRLTGRVLARPGAARLMRPARPGRAPGHQAVGRTAMRQVAVRRGAGHSRQSPHRCGSRSTRRREQALGREPTDGPGWWRDRWRRCGQYPAQQRQD